MRTYKWNTVKDSSEDRHDRLMAMLEDNGNVCVDFGNDATAHRDATNQLNEDGWGHGRQIVSFASDGQGWLYDDDRGGQWGRLGDAVDAVAEEPTDDNKVYELEVGRSGAYYSDGGWHHIIETGWVFNVEGD